MSAVIALRDWLAVLETTPSTAPLPRPQWAGNEDVEIIAAALQDLLARDNSPPIRDYVLHVILAFPSSSIWENTALEWVHDTSTPADSEHEIHNYIVQALTENDFAPNKWIEASVKDANDSLRLRDVVVGWAGMHVNLFLSHCTLQFDSPANRLPVLNLVLSMLHSRHASQANHTSGMMTKVAIHPFMTAVIHSLLYDRANQLLVLDLQTLLTVLPYYPRGFVENVPLLMTILGRMIYWCHTSFASGEGPTGMQTHAPSSDTKWAVAEPIADSGQGTPQSVSAESVVRLLLVSLYNAWPSNLLAFVRDPASYLKGKGIASLYDVGWDEVWMTGDVGRRVGPLLKKFYLHPSFLTFTSSLELLDDKRWEKSDAAEFVAQAELLANSCPADDGFWDTNQAAPPSQRSMETTSIAVEAFPLASVLGKDDEVVRLRQQNEYLRLQLALSERAQQQQLFHLQRLHRQALNHNSDEAEVHSVATRLKEQAKTISSLASELAQQRSEASQAQQKHTRWQEQLRDKLAAFRDEKRLGQSTSARLRAELDESIALALRQHEELALAKNERFKLQSQLTEINPKVHRIQDYEVRMEQLTTAQRLWDSDVRKLREAQLTAESARGRSFQLDQKVRALEREREEQNLLISRMGNQVTISSPAEKLFRKRVEAAPDLDYYMNVADNAQRRIEILEREVLELRVKIERHSNVLGPQDCVADNSILPLLWSVEVGDE